MSKPAVATDFDTQRHQYQYSPLSTDRTIRLFEIEPNESEDPVRCRTTHAAVGSGVFYRAVSYAWGDANDTCAIECDGVNLNVTRNLYAALCHFHKIKLQGWLWVDAICIDQSNVDEKNTQVRMMREIYSEATMVLIWLGEEQTTDASAIDMIHRISKVKDTIEKQPSGVQGHLEKILDLPPLGNPEWRHLYLFFKKGWFLRTWVIQEVVAARECIFMVGDQVLEYHILIEIVRLLPTEELAAAISVAAYPEGKLPIYKNPSRIALLRELHRSESGLNLAHILPLTPGFEVTDPRDRIFGLAGIAMDVEADFVDYRKSLESVLFGVAVKALQPVAGKNYFDIDFLSFVQPRLQRESLPSWIPQWRSQSPVQDPLIFSFPSDEEDAQRCRMLVVTSEKSLRLKARFIDSVKTIVDSSIWEPAMPTRLHTSDMLSASITSMQELIRWHDECKALVAGVESYATGEPIHTAFWRTLCLDHKEQERATLDFERCYLAWLELLPMTLEIVKTLNTERYTRPKRVIALVLNIFLVSWSAHCLWKHHNTIIGSFVRFAILFVLLIFAERYIVSTLNKIPPGVSPKQFLKRLVAKASDTYLYIWSVLYLWRNHSTVIGSIFRGLALTVLAAIEATTFTFLLNRLGESPEAEKAHWLKIAARHRVIEPDGRAYWIASQDRYGRHFCVTNSGYMAWVPESTKLGDGIYILQGCRIPFVLRATYIEGGHYRLVGDCYLHGFMDGEGAREEQAFTEIEIV